MFAKSKRFDDKPVGCGADAAYDPKLPIKPIGGVIPKVDRFADPKNVCSDVESVHSDKSSQVFRTPKAVRRFPGTPVHKKTATKMEFTSKELFEELLAAKSVEMHNKDETIKDYESQMKDMKDIIYHLECELADLKSQHEKELDNRTEETNACMNIITSVRAQIEELETKLIAKEKEFTEIDSLKSIQEAKIAILNEERQILEAFLLELNISDNEISFNDKIACAKTMYADKNKTILILEKNKQKLEKQNSKLNDDLVKAREEHSSRIKTLEEDFSNQLKHLNENATEKMRICEIQFEERYNDLQSYSEFQLDQEIKNRHQGLQMCQELAEKEILKSEIQIDDLSRALEMNEIKINQLSNIIDELQSEIGSKNILIEQLQNNLATSENHIITQRTSYENQIAAFKTEVERVTKEKNSFSLALETHRVTLDVISARLRNSDEDVENFKAKLESALALNNMYETEIVELQIEFSSFQDEYKQLLTTIVKSKAALDKDQQEIISNSSKVMDSLETLKSKLVDDIKNVKTDMLKDIEMFKKQAEQVISELQSKLKNEQDLRLNLKTQCDEAFSKLSTCQSLLSLAELHLESKDQELIELGAENDRLSGTLAATVQEKSELETLLKDFVKLTEDKDNKIAGYVKKIEHCEDDIFNLENRIKKLNQFLEATDFIVKEKDSEINNLKDEIVELNNDNSSLNNECLKLQSSLDKKLNEINFTNDDFKKLQASYEETREELIRSHNINSELEKEISLSNLHMDICDEESLRKDLNRLEVELAEMTGKYTDLLGHHNYKQKIKHITSLKLQNATLKEEKEKLTNTVNNQTLLIEKLKKELECTNILKSPLFQKKQMLCMSSPNGKENRASPVLQSPNRPEKPSSRQLTPLRDLNR